MNVADFCRWLRAQAVNRVIVPHPDNWTDADIERIVGEYEKHETLQKAFDQEEIPTGH